MEEVIITAIVFGSLLGMMKLWLNYRRDKNRISGAASGEPSMTASELQGLLTDVVEEAVDRRLDQLEDRIEKLLEKRDRVRLLPASDAIPDDVELEHPAPPLVARDRDATR